MLTVTPESVGMDAERLNRVVPAMQKYIELEQLAGIIVLVARKGQIACLKRFGNRNVAGKKPMELDTIFRIYSMSKPITSTAAMLLVEEGKLRLSDPLSRYIPAARNAKVLQPRGGSGGDYDLVPARCEASVHDLFTHTAGFSYGFDQNSPVDARYREQFWNTGNSPETRTLEELVNQLMELPLAFHPGTAYRYSVAIDILGYLVQLVSDVPFEEFLAERIFKPLGMVDTAFWVPGDKADRLAVLYGPKEGGGLEAPDTTDQYRFTKRPSWPSGGGGLVSTISDYFRFGQMLLDRGSLDGTRILGRATVEWMMQNHLPAGLRQDGDSRGANGFGLGGSVLLDPGLSHVPGSPGKFGWGGAATTSWWIDPAEDLLCILMTQYMPGFGVPVVDDFTQTVYQAIE